MYRPLLLAAQFLTRIPLPSLRHVEPRDAGRSMLFYPLVGLLIGVLLFGAGHLMQGATPLLRAAILVALWVVITGGIHLDGLADMADAWVGGHGNRERTMAIMKDPYCGPIGVVALLLVLLLKVAALAQISGVTSYALIVAPLLGRTLLLLLFLTTPYVRPGGIGETMFRELPRKAGWAIVTGVFAGVTLFPSVSWGIVPAIIGLFLLFRYELMRRLGGTTGDTAGALLELCESTVLICAALM